MRHFLLALVITPLFATSVHAKGAGSIADQREFRAAGEKKLKSLGIKAQFSQPNKDSGMKVTVKGKANVQRAFKALADKGDKPGTEGDGVLVSQDSKVDFSIGTKKAFRRLGRDERE
jgi:hypothetical protein